MRNVRGRVAATVTAGLLGVGAAIAVPAAAEAGNSAYCTGSWVCVYKNWDFGIGLGYRTSSFSLQNISDANNDEVSSWENRRGATARWYVDANGGGACHTMASYSENSRMNTFTQNDRMSSWAGNGGC